MEEKERAYRKRRKSGRTEKEKREGEERQKREVPVDRMNRFRSFFECSKREGS